MGSRVKRALDVGLAQLGYSPARETGFRAEALSPFLGLLKRDGFAPRHIIDVGANRGEWTRTALQTFPEARYTLVEPQEGLRRYVEDLIADGRKIEWIVAGVSDQAGTRWFTIAERDDSSTFAMSEEEARAAGLRQVPVAVRTLNEIAASGGEPWPELVKIDAEGLDLRVLAGASELLGKTDVFLVEAAVCAPLENSVAEVIGRMGKAGYRLADITDLNRSPKFGVLWLCELAFVRNGSAVLESVRSYE
jgi:FkbM family methyltransferase